MNQNGSEPAVAVVIPFTEFAFDFEPVGRRASTDHQEDSLLIIQAAPNASLKLASATVFV